MEEKPRIIKTIDEILEEQEIILADGSLRGEEEGNGVGYETYAARRYEELNLKVLEETQKSFLYFISLLKNEKVFTIREVVGEIKRLEEILNEKIRYCNDNKETRYKGDDEIISRKTRRRKEREDIGNERLRQLQQLVYRTRKTAERKSLLFDEKYSILFQMTWLISEKIRLKKDTSYFLGVHAEDRAYESDTDEKLAAGILWLSLFSDKKPALLTRDTHFVSLLGVIPRLIGSNDFAVYNEFFKKRLNENPFSLYLRTDENKYELAIDSRNAEYSNEFKIFTLSEAESDKARWDIRALWGKMSDKISGN